MSVWLILEHYFVWPTWWTLLIFHYYARTLTNVATAKIVCYDNLLLFFTCYDWMCVIYLEELFFHNFPKGEIVVPFWIYYILKNNNMEKCSSFPSYFKMIFWCIGDTWWTRCHIMWLRYLGLAQHARLLHFRRNFLLKIQLDFI